MKNSFAALIVLSLCAGPAWAQEHGHPEPETLGTVSFPTTCAASVQGKFNRGMALLHSFTYTPAEAAFREVVREDPDCVMARWGTAMSLYHQLWEPALPGDSLERGRAELDLATQAGGGSAEEKEYLAAAAIVFNPSGGMYPERAKKYRDAMGMLAQKHPGDVEAQIFYALA